MNSSDFNEYLFTNIHPKYIRSYGEYKLQMITRGKPENDNKNGLKSPAWSSLDIRRFPEAMFTRI